MSTETAWTESIGVMLMRLRAIVEDGGDSEPVRDEIIARCKGLVQERDAAVAALAAERAATETSTVALRAELDALIAEIDRARRERREVVAENLRVANMVSDLRSHIDRLQEENLLLKRQLSAQEAATFAAEQRASAVPSSAAPSDLLARLEEAERSASAWQEVAGVSADELRRARYIIAVQASRIDDFRRHQPAEPEPPTQDSP